MPRRMNAEGRTAIRLKDFSSRQAHSASYMSSANRCALGGTMEWLIAGRAIQGLGGGDQRIFSQAIIADIFPHKEPRQVHRIHGRSVRGEHGRGVIARRSVHRVFELAVVLLDQPAAGHNRAGGRSYGISLAGASIKFVLHRCLKAPWVHQTYHYKHCKSAFTTLSP